MQYVEVVRMRIVRQMINLKAWISSLDGDKEMLSRLSGKDGQHRLERIVEYVMTELGVENSTDTATRKAMRKVLGG